MKIYTFTEARRNLSEVLDIARSEEVIIRRKGGDNFTVRLSRSAKSPLDIQPIKTRATTQDIIKAVRESRRRIG